MSRFVIHKSSRVPSDESYSGPTWDSAGIRDRYKPVYDNVEEAIDLAYLLTKANPVGFRVFCFDGSYSI